jgi:hypothetical protein
MTYRGTVQNGVVVLESPTALPDGTSVTVQPVEFDDAQPAPAAPDDQSWGEVLRDFVGQAQDLPSDMAQNHDHYIHGARRR